MADVIIKSRYMPVERVKVMFEGLGRTKPEFKESCDINHILQKYQRTGVLPVVKNPALYEDFSDALSYQDACHVVMAAQTQFEQLPAKIRKRFANDPALFLEFCEDEGNRDEMIELGLAPKPKVVEEPLQENVTTEE